MGKYFFTRKNVFEVTQNEDGLISLSPATNQVDRLIYQAGGRRAFLAKCVDDPRPLDVIVHERDQQLQAQIEQQRAAEAERFERMRVETVTAYERLVSQGVIEVNAMNLLIVMSYLNLQDLECWHLPKMSQAYTAEQHDCGDRTVTTIRLEEGIVVDGELVKDFVYGTHSRRYLFKKYTDIKWCVD